MKGLTVDELAALRKLAEAIDAIHSLPRNDPADFEELVPHFHAIQEKVMARAAARAYPDFFNGVDQEGPVNVYHAYTVHQPRQWVKS